MKDEIDFEDISTNAHYTRAAIHESFRYEFEMIFGPFLIFILFRICPVAFSIARILEEDFVLSGHNIKAGVVIFILFECLLIKLIFI